MLKAYNSKPLPWQVPWDQAPFINPFAIKLFKNYFSTFWIVMWIFDMKTWWGDCVNFWRVRVRHEYCRLLAYSIWSSWFFCGNRLLAVAYADFQKKVNLVSLLHLKDHFPTMKVFAGLVATTLAAPAPAIIGGKNAVDGQFPHQVRLTKCRPLRAWSSFQTPIDSFMLYSKAL